MPIPTKHSVPSLAGVHLRHRPVIATVVLGGPVPQLRDGLLDTGADDTVFSHSVAAALGLDLSAAEHRVIGLVGRPQPVSCQYARVILRISDGIEVFELPATVGFVAVRLHYALLGQAGFLQFFSADFDGEARTVTLTPKPTFPGRRI
jgi:hypothetical protein